MVNHQREHSSNLYYQQKQRPRVNANATIASSRVDQSTNKVHAHVEGLVSVAGTDMESLASPTPLFERLVSEEVQELKSYARIIESQNRRISDLERIHDDLEARLELQTKERMDLEEKLEEEKRKWATDRDVLDKECSAWKGHAQSERMKNERLLDQINRKDKEIHRMIQRKYDAAKTPHQPPHGHVHNRSLSHGDGSGRRVDSARLQQPSSTSIRHVPSYTDNQHSGPHDILHRAVTDGAVRERNVTHSLLDFFGM
mmetsp:Transcript_24675/g.29801  ORF Transcript_24675/g.29801 Transcript_24675/m.29801 type:complete len:257 (-) Transcript_24675:211-981(-)|eukprot:CAMPEP_0172484690 /NCGR_PEP_ID=MMETSP1066-20121228/12261_1 /TAXON_ID=671091 /ORGANISM="Coscinodiscus wailesii, Strain CCMP2513" /LENGTH=256 /DNA_ID=CAMNT_0013249377 /DNA_START=50 /DNA_END=820 /DNA_ORIENTATION=-